MPTTKATQPEGIWIPIELDEDEQHEGFDTSEPRQVHAAYCGLQAPKRRLPKGVPVKKAIPAWGL